MAILTKQAELDALYGQPAEPAKIKVTTELTPAYRRWIEQSRFCILSTTGPSGTDASPRGDDGPVVRIEDSKTILMPDWRGNQRIDSLRNIIADPRVSLMFMIAGSNNVIRINGSAQITGDKLVCQSFIQRKQYPKVVVVVSVSEVYFQCARALMRSRLWLDGNQSLGLPTPGDIMAEITSGTFDGEAYDNEWPERASKSMW